MPLFRRAASRDTAVSRTSVESDELEVVIDVYWCDAHGTQVSGWAHLGGRPVSQLGLETRSGHAEAAVTIRTDLPAFFGGDPAMESAGFSVYLPGPPDVELCFSARIGSGIVRRVIPVPRHPLPIVPSAEEGRGWHDAVRDAVAAAPAGPVLALGVRTARIEDDRRLRARFPGREVIGVDIHPGTGVDVVADVHELDRTFGAAIAAIVYSGSLLEHVAAPWLVARACAAVLVPGGYSLHHAPWAWPTHAEPNDFWRMSPEGLRQLFTPALGFEIVETGATTDVRMHVEPDALAEADPRAQMLAFSTTNSAAASWIVARKIAPAPPAVVWPYAGTVTADVAARYPIDGISASAP